MMEKEIKDNQNISKMIILMIKADFLKKIQIMKKMKVMNLIQMLMFSKEKE